MYIFLSIFSHTNALFPCASYKMIYLYKGYYYSICWVWIVQTKCQDFLHPKVSQGPTEESYWYCVNFSLLAIGFGTSETFSTVWMCAAWYLDLQLYRHLPTNIAIHN